jgi:hypothetical protein
MNTSKVPVRIADEINRIAAEIGCLAALLMSADIYGEFPGTGPDGLGSIMNGWRDALSRLTGEKA